MRILAGILVLITLIVGTYVGYCYIGITMEIESVTSSWKAAVDDLETFNQINYQIENGSFSGVRVVEAPLPDPESMSFLTLTVRMRNRGLLPQDWIEIHIEPKDGDYLFLAQERTPTLAAGTLSDFSTILLTRASVDGSRSLRITYYVLGRQYQVDYAMP